MSKGVKLQKGEGRNFRKPNNMFTIPCENDVGFFKWWCVFLKPFINLTNREIDVIAEFLKQRFELSKVISDPAVLDKMVMNDDTKMKVIEACGITQQHFYVVMSNLRKHKVLIGDIINPRLIPNVREDDQGVFQLLILFKDQEKK